MKTSIKVVIRILALGIVVLVGLQLMLQYGLTKAMRDIVLPRVKEETGIDAQVGRLSVNAAGGILHLKQVAVRNPEGFELENFASVEQINVEVDVMSLLTSKPILVRNVTVDRAEVNVIRNREGRINLETIQEGLPKAERSVEPSKVPGQPAQIPEPRTPIPQNESEKTPAGPEGNIEEMIIEALHCQVRLRYLDQNFDNLDLRLVLNVKGAQLSTLKAEDAAWGTLAIQGSLGSEKTGFRTDLNLKLAPVTNPQAPSFNLSGRIMEIDPRILDKVYDKVGIRSSPFGLEPQLYCRNGWFRNSVLALEIPDIVFEDKLAKQLGGVGSIGSLKFTVPLEGSLQEPEINVLGALKDSIGGNVPGLFKNILGEVIRKESGNRAGGQATVDAAVDLLAEKIDEIGESETAKKILKDLAGGKSSDTNAPPSISSDSVVDLLGEHIEEIGGDEELKKGLKNLGRSLFGK